MDSQTDDDAAESAELDSRLLSAIVQTQNAFIQERDLRTACARILNLLLQLTRSKYGFVGEVLYTEAQAPYLLTHALTDVSWDDASKKLYDENMARGFEFHNLNTLFGVTLATGEAVISNNPSQDPRGGGLPSGHPGMSSYLGLPITYRDELVGMIGIANREDGYSQELADFLSPLLVTAGSMISSRREAERGRAIKEDLESKNTLLEAVINNIKDSLIVTDHAGRIVRANRAMEILSGYRSAELCGESLSKVLSPEDGDALLAELKKFIVTGERFLVDTRFEMKGVCKGGVEVPLDLLVSEIKLAGRKLFVHIIRDITEIKQVQADLEKANVKLQSLSDTDELTGIGNRRAFERELKRAINRARSTDGQIGLALIDIDHFKAFNDNYGHQQGDVCLRSIGECFREFFKRECEFVARVGGEEFAVIMAQMSLDECVQSLEAFRARVRALDIEHRYSEHERVTCSIGFAVQEPDMQGAGALYRTADEALYAAKNHGRNRVSLADQISLESLLKHE